MVQLQHKITVTPLIIITINSPIPTYHRRHHSSTRILDIKEKHYKLTETNMIPKHKMAGRLNESQPHYYIAPTMGRR